MSKKYHIWEQHSLNYVTCTTVGWIDLFTRPVYKNIIINSWKYCQQQKGFHIVAYVIMSNHFHLIGWVDAGQTPNQTLSTVLRDIKRHTTRELVKAIKTEPESRREWMLKLFQYYAKKNRPKQQHQIWAEGDHPIALWSPHVIWHNLFRSIAERFGTFITIRCGSF